MNQTNLHSPAGGRALHYSYPPNATTLVVFDTKVNDYLSLTAGVRADAAVLILHPDQDGVQQITQALQASPSVQRLHIVAHGAPGSVELGDRPLSLTTLKDYLWELQHWFTDRSTPDRCSISLYGCQVGAGDAGAEFLQALHQITGASIAASTTLVGNAALGGNWELDATVGTPEKGLAIAPDTRDAYTGVLVSLTFENPVLESGPGTGLQVGAVYRYTGVATDPDTGAVLDALITIEAFNGGATVANIDATPLPDFTSAFQPSIRGNGPESSVDFLIEFVVSGTNTPVIAPDFPAIVLDLDGSGGSATNTGREFAELSSVAAVTTLQDSLVTVEPSLAFGASGRRFLGAEQNFDFGNNEDGIDARLAVAIGYTGVSSFRLRAGVLDAETAPNNMGNRLFAISFDESLLPQITPPVIVPVNAPPAPDDDAATTSVNVPVTIPILVGDSDPEDGALTVTNITLLNGVTATVGTPVSLPSGATVTLNANGTVTYVPPAGFVGTEAFPYTVTDSGGINRSATVTVTVQDGPPVNTPPVATNDTASYLPNTPVTLDLLANDTDNEDPNNVPAGGITAINGTPIAVGQSVTLPSGSVVLLNADGTVTYTPAPGQTGVEEFSYTITDSGEATDTAIATLTPGDDGGPFPPTATNDTAGTSPDTPVTLNLLGNDTDPEDGIPGGGITQINGVDIVPGTPATLPSGGIVLLNNDGTVTYTPPAGFLGVETFTYTVADSDGLTSTANVSVTVSATDTDGDGIPDAIDIDDDNDGIPDTVEEMGSPDLDTDGDGIPDRLDLDSDNDGILDVEEAGHDVGDPDGDGRLDGPYGPNGLADIVETAPESDLINYIVVDTDGDGVRDFQDLDSDNDGITDVVEGSATGQNPDPDGDGIIGTGTPVDTDGDGIADDVDPDNGGTPSPVPDTDGDGKKDYRDIDTDNDGIFDLIEQGGGYPDTNGDGVVDGVDTDGDGILDPVDEAEGSFGSAPLSIPFPPDTDGSGIPDWRELPINTTGTPGPDVIVGGAGDNVLNGFSDPDILTGGNGNDRINGGSDSDVLTGGAGDDLINGGSGRDRMDGGSGNDAMNGGSGNDIMLGRSGNDIMSGGRGRDLMRGGSGRDEMSGDAGRDALFGEGGRDIIDGGRGGDTIVGGFGADQLMGGQGRDRFVYESIRDFGDTILDFEIVKDILVFNINGIDSLDDLVLRQQGSNTLVQARTGGGLREVATLIAVEADTLDAANFSF
ncbi:MAG: DUF4347 domain-containing protein [Synechococcales bacterium]|nr:DUF4347 domain-containing protein [Synechococcales bacterium]